MTNISKEDFRIVLQYVTDNVFFLQDQDIFQVTLGNLLKNHRSIQILQFWLGNIADNMTWYF